MRYLTLSEVLDLHQRVLAQSCGAAGVRDQNGLDSAVVQPLMAFGGQDLYPTLVEKAAALAFSLVMNHPFVDGNKRVGHAAMETFLVLNGHGINASVIDQEQVFLQLAAGVLTRTQLVDWLKQTVVKKP